VHQGKNLLRFPATGYNITVVYILREDAVPVQLRVPRYSNGLYILASFES